MIHAALLLLALAAAPAPRLDDALREWTEGKKTAAGVRDPEATARFATAANCFDLRREVGEKRAAALATALLARLPQAPEAEQERLAFVLARLQDPRAVPALVGLLERPLSSALLGPGPELHRTAAEGLALFGARARSEAYLVLGGSQREITWRPRPDPRATEALVARAEALLAHPDAANGSDRLLDAVLDALLSHCGPARARLAQALARGPLPSEAARRLVEAQAADDAFAASLEALRAADPAQRARAAAALGASARPEAVPALAAALGDAKAEVALAAARALHALAGEDAPRLPAKVNARAERAWATKRFGAHQERFDASKAVGSREPAPGVH